MVVMVMADQHDVDPGQRIERDPRRCDARGADAERPGGAAPHRIGQDVEPLRLHQDGGMADPGRHHPFALDPRGRRYRVDGDMIGPGGPPIAIGEIAPQEIPAPAVGRGDVVLGPIRIEEALAGIVRRGQARIIARIQKARDDRDRKAQADDEPQDRDAQAFHKSSEAQ
ncbi:hypothetical protein D9M73_115810 [compost metagenome]